MEVSAKSHESDEVEGRCENMSDGAIENLRPRASAILVTNILQETAFTL
ncbi:MAG: hypothetical protein IPP49_01995 [Saprospiraceae bacterium]|nr:hypothetical protein [Saprospiraceae bacterium]